MDQEWIKQRKAEAQAQLENYIGLANHAKGVIAALDLVQAELDKAEPKAKPKKAAKG